MWELFCVLGIFMVSFLVGCLLYDLTIMTLTKKVDKDLDQIASFFKRF